MTLKQLFAINDFNQVCTHTAGLCWPLAGCVGAHLFLLKLIKLPAELLKSLSGTLTLSATLIV